MAGEDNTPLPSGTDTALTVDTAAKAIFGLLDSPDDDEGNTQAPKEAKAAKGKDEDEPEADPEEGEDEGEPEDEEADTAKDEPEQESAPLKLKLDDGSEITLDEARKGYLRQSDYTRKQQDLARERDEVRTSREQFSQTEQQTRAALERALTIVQAVMPQKPDPRLLETDPFEYQKQRANWESWQEWHHTLDADRRQADAESATRQTEQHREFLREQNRLLVEALPELKDKAKRDEWKGQLLSTLPEAYGFSPDEILETADHRILRMATDAAKWRKLQQSKPKALAAAKEAPPVQKPGARPTPNQVKGKVQSQKVERLRQTGRVEDAARAIVDLL